MRHLLFTIQPNIQTMRMSAYIKGVLTLLRAANTNGLRQLKLVPPRQETSKSHQPGRMVVKESKDEFVLCGVEY